MNDPRDIPPDLSDATQSTGGRQTPEGCPTDEPNPRQDSDILEFPVVEGFELLEILGKGGFGIVYKARQVELNRLVALKMLPALAARFSPGAVERFRREATLAARLHHTNIVPIHLFGESVSGFFIAMEFIDGQPLNELLKRLDSSKAHSASAFQLEQIILGNADLRSSHASSTSKELEASRLSNSRRGHAYFEQVARWMADVASALHFGHDAGIIHRDIKPGNLILSKDGRMMVTDYGLAKNIDDTSVTTTGSLLGTYRYMSPEQAMAKRMPIDRRTDIYSLGATMYELLVFEPAVPGEDQKEIISRLMTHDPIAPRSINRSIPVDLETICTKCLERSPADRYSSAGDLEEDLRRFIRKDAIKARKVNVARRIARWGSRRKATVIGLVSIIALVGMSLGLWQMSSALRFERTARLDSDAIAIKLKMDDSINRGDYSSACLMFESAPEPLKDQREVARGYATALLRQRRRGEAVAVLEPLARDYPNDAGLLYALADALRSQDRQRATECVNRAEALGRETAETYYHRSMLTSDPEVALSLLAKAVALRPDYFEALMAQTWRYFGLRRFDQAHMTAEKAYSHRPEDPRAMCNLAASLLQADLEHERSLELLDAATLADPTLFQPHFNRGIALEKLKRYDDAEAAYAKALEIRPGFGPAVVYQGRARLTRGILSGDKVLESAGCDLIRRGVELSGPGSDGFGFLATSCNEPPSPWSLSKFMPVVGSKPDKMLERLIQHDFLEPEIRQLLSDWQAAGPRHKCDIRHASRMALAQLRVSEYASAISSCREILECDPQDNLAPVVWCISVLLQQDYERGCRIYAAIMNDELSDSTDLRPLLEELTSVANASCKAE